MQQLIIRSELRLKALNVRDRYFNIGEIFS